MTDTTKTRLTGLTAPNRKDMALMYADAIVRERNGAITVDWRAINEGILERWSPSGLNWIKASAWKLVETR